MTRPSQFVCEKHSTLKAHVANRSIQKVKDKFFFRDNFLTHKTHLFYGQGMQLHDHNLLSEAGEWEIAITYVDVVLTNLKIFLGF